MSVTFLLLADSSAYMELFRIHVVHAVFMYRITICTANALPPIVAQRRISDFASPGATLDHRTAPVVGSGA